MKKNLLVFIFTFSVLNCINAQWAKVNVSHTNNSVPLCVQVPNASTVWVSVYESPTSFKYLRTKDGGATWEKKAIAGAPAGYAISNLYALDADTCYAAMYDANDNIGGGIFKTTNGGITWKQLGEGLIFDENSFPDFIYFWDAQHGVALGDRNLIPGTEDISLEVYTTEDYGSTWNRVPKENLPTFTNQPIGIVNNYCVYEGKLWCQVFDGEPGTGAPQYIYKTEDKGLTWKSFPITTPSDFSDIVFTDVNNGVVIGSTNSAGGGSAFLSRTTDGGETWSDVAYQGPLMWSFISNVPGTSSLVSCAANSNGGLTGSSYSYDLGNTWTQIDDGSSGINGLHTDVSFLNSSVGWSGQQTLGLLSGGMYKWTGSVLPVSLSLFTASNVNNGVSLTWQTTQESNFSYFVVERSGNGIDFTEISSVNAKGNTTMPTSYSYMDFSYFKGLNFYRLKLVNEDGSFNYSITQKLDMILLQSVKIYPNPVKNVLQIVGLNSNNLTKISIISADGKVIHNNSVVSANYTFNSSSLPSGNYFIIIESEDKVVRLQFVK